MEFAVVEVQITNLNLTWGSINHTHFNLFLIMPDGAQLIRPTNMFDRRPDKAFTPPSGNSS
ncbi:hypothetical protein E5284_23105 [Citrobacter freundii]|nr:hypothetical protein E5284_23105 [Citrobacter freundii]